ncbi:hypothetical protein CPB86DRAFT_350562 [Serendipita vermifera]|nr:hypothetical protein CPB86DRAFT_350562 [Serendipita vermifera]
MQRIQEQFQFSEGSNGYCVGRLSTNDPVNYASLGSFNNHLSPGNPSDAVPDFKPGSTATQTAAVRRDLCTEAKYSDVPVGGFANNPYTLWKILSKDSNGMSLDLLGVSPNGDKPAWTPWTLKENVIEWVPVD